MTTDQVDAERRGGRVVVEVDADLALLLRLRDFLFAVDTGLPVCALSLLTVGVLRVGRLVLSQRVQHSDDKVGRTLADGGILVCKGSAPLRVHRCTCARSPIASVSAMPENMPLTASMLYNVHRRSTCLQQAARLRSACEEESSASST